MMEMEVEVKPELVLTVEPEQQQPGCAHVELGYEECVLCSARTNGKHNIHYKTANGHFSLCTYIGKLAKLNLELITHTKYVCATCFNLVNLIEYTELEFYANRNKLLEIIARNKLLKDVYNEQDSQTPYELIKVKEEDSKNRQHDNSDSDEPLARQAKDKKHNPNLAEHNREDSSDDDFYWKLDTTEDDIISTATASRPKKSRRKVKVKNVADLCQAELKEQVDGETKEPKNKSSKKVKDVFNKIKIKNPNEKRGRKKKTCGANSNEPTKCTECDKVLKPRQLKYHMAQVHKTIPHEFVCEMCGRGFMTKKECSDHVSLHLGITDWKCEPCNKLFPNKKTFLRHDKIHNGVPKYQCDLCGKSFIHESSYRMHLVFHSGVRKAECDICGMAFFITSHLNRHKRTHENEKKFGCEVCGKKFATQRYMQVHRKTHDKEKPERHPDDTPRKVYKWFRCTMCEQKFDRQFKMELHLVHDHNQVLKKGPPKPRHTWKKMQRAKAAAAAAAANTIVNAIAMAISANTDQNQTAQSNSEPVSTRSPV